MGNMGNLLNCNVRRFEAVFENDTKCTGRIRVENNEVFLCQNERDGRDCKDKFGFAYSWCVGIGDKESLKNNNVCAFRLLNLTNSEIESYKDWVEGDKIKNGSHVWTIEARIKGLVFAIDENNEACGPFTCDQLHEAGYRIVADPVEDETIEVELDELLKEFAKTHGVDMSKVKVK